MIDIENPPAARPARRARTAADQELFRQLVTSSAPQPLSGRAGVRVRARLRLPMVRRLAPTMALGAALVTGVALGIPVLGHDRPSSATVSVTAEKGYYRIVFSDLSGDNDSDSAAISQQLARQGIRVFVSFSPASPSRVGTTDGTIGGFGQDSWDYRLEYQPGADLGKDLVSMLVPRHLDEDSSISITIGRRARPGEDYMIQGNAESRGEPLHCHPIIGGSLAHAEQVLNERGLEVQWYGIPGDPEDAPATDYVAGVDSMSATKVMVMVGTAATRASDLKENPSLMTMQIPEDC